MTTKDAVETSAEDKARMFTAKELADAIMEAHALATEKAAEIAHNFTQWPADSHISVNEAIASAIRAELRPYKPHCTKQGWRV